ncbi:MAG TPA: ABC transporter substrate-binding protein [Stellaceae bacterium]|nr:ABC transporter substrate-binding protein [Stellaceae bacterium]
MRALRAGAAALLCVVAAPGAHAAEKVEAGFVGAAVAPIWPFLIADSKGLFAVQGIAFEFVFGPTAPGIVQQLAAGSLDVAIAGAADPIHAVDKGAPIAILRVIGQAAPYELIGKKGIASLAQLKGKTVSIGGPADITAVYWDRMARAGGLAKGEYDLIFGGSTGARLAALQSGSADAAMLIPPVNFRAKEAGFVTIALAMDYARDLIFSVMAANRAWAAAHAATARALDDAVTQAVAWLHDDANRTEAIDIFVKASHSSRPDAEASYDFFRQIDFFERTGAVSRARLQNLIDAQRALGDIATPLTADRLVMQDVTKLAE